MASELSVNVDQEQVTALPEESGTSEGLEEDEQVLNEDIDVDLEDYDLGGESGGEQAASSDDPFFVSKKAAAVFKHRLIQVYFPKFAGKAGSTEADKRLAYVDTHAGRGEYDDGTAGSPLLIADNVAHMAQRRIDCYFVEKRRGNHERLREVLSEHMPAGATWETRRGTASEHLADSLSFAGNSPLFMFIDPYGLGPTFPEVVQVLNRPRQGYGSKTEVLLNFISSAFGRAGGYLKFDNPTDQQVKTLTHLDEVLDGPWWRSVYLSTEVTSDAVAAIARAYAEKIHAVTGCSWTLMPVKNRAHHVPLYWLLHFTRHPDGVWWIREAAAMAGRDWRRHCSPPPPSEEGVLFAREDPFPQEEEQRHKEWVDTIEANARALLDSHGRIDVRADAYALFGETFGLAWSKHLREALSRLFKDGVLFPKPLSAGLDKYVGQRV
jgi:three-Cys-motif partner protein